MLALLADGAAWSTSALALALDTSQRTVQRALVELEAAKRVRSIGRARAQRWLVAAARGIHDDLVTPCFAAGRLDCSHAATRVSTAYRRASAALRTPAPRGLGEVPIRCLHGKSMNARCLAGINRALGYTAWIGDAGGSYRSSTISRSPFTTCRLT